MAQLEERHRAELERVHADRDRVLAQETQATLAGERAAFLGSTHLCSFSLLVGGNVLQLSTYC